MLLSRDTPKNQSPIIHPTTAYLTRQLLYSLYLDGGLHYDTGGIIHTLRAQLQHCRVALLLGLRQVLVNLLQSIRNRDKAHIPLLIIILLRNTHTLPARQHGVHKLPVQRGTALGGRRQQPDDHDHLHLVVEGEPGQKDVRERFDAGEEGKHYPVHHPLDLQPTNQPTRQGENG